MAGGASNQAENTRRSRALPSSPPGADTADPTNGAERQVSESNTAFTATLKAAYDVLAASAASTQSSSLAAAASVLSRMLPSSSEQDNTSANPTENHGTSSNAAVRATPVSRKRGRGASDDIAEGMVGLAQQEAMASSSRPMPGTPEWARLKKFNHAQVEKKRRDAINEGINELQMLLPNQIESAQNKGLILKQSVQYIQRLKDEVAENAEKWAMEKMIFEQAINELTEQVTRLKDENLALQNQLLNK